MPRQKRETTIDELEFLIENNAIERVYDADSLTQAKLAWEYLMSKKTLTPSVVLKIHKILMLNQPLLPSEKGYFRQVPVWIGGREALSWEKIPEAIIGWCLDVMTSIELPGKNGNNIRLDHISYEKIHPFVDGNGRTGRMFYNWSRLRAGLPLHTIHEGTEQQEYYQWFK